MRKRVAAAFLWFLTGWTLGAMAAYVAGVSELAAPALGAVLAALVAGDPMGAIWGPASEIEKARSTATARLGELPSLR